MTDPHEQVAKTVGAILEALSFLGVPGAEASKRAVEGIEKLRQSHNARERLVALVASNFENCSCLNS